MKIWNYNTYHISGSIVSGSIYNTTNLLSSNLKSTESLDTNIYELLPVDNGILITNYHDFMDVYRLWQDKIPCLTNDTGSHKFIISQSVSYSNDIPIYSKSEYLLISSSVVTAINESKSLDSEKKLLLDDIDDLNFTIEKAMEYLS